MTDEEIDRLLEQAVREAAPEELYKYPFARLVAAAEREACVYRANIALLGADRGLANRVNQAIRNRT